MSMTEEKVEIRLFDENHSSRDMLLKTSSAIGAICFLLFVPFHFLALKSLYLSATSFTVGCFLLLNAFYLSKFNSFEFTMNLTLIVSFIQIQNLSFILGGTQNPGLCWYIFFLGVCITVLNFRSSIAWICICLLVFPILYALERTPLHLYQIYLTKEDWSLTYLLNFFAFIISSSFLFYYFSKAIKKSYSEINKSKEFLTELIRMIGHDINNPLTVIEGHLEVIQDLPRLTDNETKHITQIKNETILIKNVIDRVREWKALETGKKELKLSSVNIQEMIDESLRNLEAKAKLKNVQVKCSPFNKPYFVFCDRDALVHQVLHVIIDNAIKYSFPKSEIHINHQYDEKHFTLVIQDKGIGIPEKDLKRIITFDRQCLRKGTRGEEGAGFALPLAAILLHMMGASFKIQTKDINYHKDHGTEFEIKLLLAEEARGPHQK